MRFKTLISMRNLDLAWRRINTGRNIQYKRFFRSFYLGYEAGLRPNLRLLHSKLMSGWEPHAPTRIYLPKPSGLQRPITLLGIEDQIVFQAVANVFAVALEKRRRKVELRNVFSNVLNDPNDTIFFVHRWQETYAKFQEACQHNFRDGFRWIAHFDLAAYYDTISHKQLIRVAAPRTGKDETWKAVSRWLQVWTGADGAPLREHGIPQGPIASNFLAEAFFLPIDEQMTRSPVRYMRYVDDIRIFAKTAVDAQTAAIQLEQACHNHGLIPHGKKFAIIEASSLTDVMGQLPSIPPVSNDIDTPPMELVKAESLLKGALNPHPLSVKDKSRLRYVLYRAPKSRRILSWVLKLLDRHPEHIDEFAHYLSNFRSGRRIQQSVVRMLQNGVPYGYVRGELWHILARIGSRSILAGMLSLGRQDARNRKRCVAWSWGLVNFFMRCHEERLSQYARLLRSAPPLARALLVPEYEDHLLSCRGLGCEMMASGTLEERIAIAREMRKRHLRLSDLGLLHNNTGPEAQNILKGLGVIYRRKYPTRDHIGEKLATRFGTPHRTFWQKVFGNDYEHALQILLEAEGAFEIDRSHWLSLQNSFNDALTRHFVSYLGIKGLPGVVSTVGRNHKLVKFGSILQRGNPFSTHHTQIAEVFREVNERRNRLPGCHPYEEKGGNRTKFLGRKERDRLHGCMATAYDTIIGLIDAHGIP